MSGKFTRGGIAPNYTYGGRPVVPANPASDPEYERAQPLTRDDRRAMLRRHFEAGGMAEAQIEAALLKAMV